MLKVKYVNLISVIQGDFINEIEWKEPYKRIMSSHRNKYNLSVLTGLYIDTYGLYKKSNPVYQWPFFNDKKMILSVTFKKRFLWVILYTILINYTLGVEIEFITTVVTLRHNDVFPFLSGIISTL